MRKLCRVAAVLLAALAASCLLVLPQVLDKNLLFDGAENYIFYTHSESSNAEITLASAEDAARVKLFLCGVTGESARYECAESAFAQAEKYGARLQFSESAGGVVNYYYYSLRLGGGVRLCGYTVNLHVAVRGAGACIGSPVIFGGY